MALALRVIPCLDVSGGRVVKGVNFSGLRDAGDPVELAEKYDRERADEITFLDVSATAQGRGAMLDIIRATAEKVFVPMTVGGGIRSVQDVRELLGAGADKIEINSAAVARPELIGEIADAFGAQVVVLSLDARRTPEGVHTPSGYEITTHAGTRSTGIDLLEFAHAARERGAGEILLNSMDADGTRAGFDVEMTTAVREVTNLPLIASGGAGSLDDFVAAARCGVDAVLAASVFHFGTLSIRHVKEHLEKHGFPVRL